MPTSAARGSLALTDSKPIPELGSEVEARLTKALADLHLWQERYHSIGETIPFGIWICDANGRLTYCSQAILDLLGMTMDEVAGAGWYKTLHPDDAADTERAWNECVRTGKQWVRLHRYRGKDGRYHPALARGRPLRIREWVGVNFEVAELMAAQEQLTGSPAKCQGINPC